MSSRKEKAWLVAISVAVSIRLVWYLMTDTGLGLGTTALIGLMTSCGIWGMLLCLLDETPERQPVIAPFLERHLLEPQEQRLLEQGREEERKANKARIAAARKLLAERGFNPDQFLPAEDSESVK